MNSSADLSPPEEILRRATPTPVQLQPRLSLQLGGGDGEKDPRPIYLETPRNNSIGMAPPTPGTGSPKDKATPPAQSPSPDFGSDAGLYRVSEDTPTITVPSVPFNTPVDRADWEAILEAQKEEQHSRAVDEEVERILNMETPERKGVHRPRKRLLLDTDDATLDAPPPPPPAPGAYDPALFTRLEELVAEERIHLVSTPRAEREKQVLDLLRMVVPGIGPGTEKTFVLEASAKYLQHLKNNVGSQYDEEWLANQLPF